MKPSRAQQILPEKSHRLWREFETVTRPSKVLSPDRWAAANRTHPQTSGVPGPRDPYLTPYIVEPERMIAAGTYRRVILVIGSQTGKTELMLDVAGHRLDQRPGPILYVGPNKQFLSEQFEPRVMALLDGSAVLTDKVSRGKRMTKTRKMVGGVPFRLAHAGSSSALKSDPAVLALVDEYDEMKADVNNQGGPLGLVERRGDTYADFVCVVTSTPKKGRVAAVKDEKSGLIFWDVAVKEDVDSPIWAIWQQGTRHHWCWPCPHCAEYFVPRFDLLHYPVNATPLEAAREAYLECPNCHGVIEEQHKAVMNERGRYAAPGQAIDRDGIIRGIHREAKALSYWVSGLCSPFVTIGERAAVYVEAIASGDPAEVQQAINGGFGELYSPGGGEVPEWAEIKEKSRRSVYTRGTVPEEAIYLTLTADVQKQSIPWTIRAWGPRATSWLVDFGYLRGDTAEEEIWHALADLVSTPIEGMPISLSFVDSGFRPGKTDTLPLNRVYEFCRRFGRRVRATKGSSSPMRTPLIFSKIEVSRKDGRAAKYGLDLVRLDTDHWKSWVHERLRWPEDRPGGWNVPKGIDDDYCHQIVSEARLKTPSGRPEWVQRGRHNHFLDCFSPDTDALTRHGWRPIASISKSDLVATVNLETDEIEYQQPTKVIGRHHDGEMVAIRGRRIDALVTPNHRMVTYRRNPVDPSPQITLAKDLTIWHTLKLTAKWSGSPSTESGDWMEFLGWFVAEGHMKGRSPVISQNPGAKQVRILALAKRLGLKFHISGGRQIVFSCAIEAPARACYGEGSGRGAYRKVVPQCVKDAPPKLISRFVEAAVLGDGWQQGKFRIYATTSHRLAGDMQELFIKLGRSANIVSVQPPPSRIRGKAGGPCAVQWHVSETRTAAASLRQSDNSPIFSTVPYDGMVHCVSVPNGTLVVRRRGKAFIAGNCEAMQAAAGYLLNVQRIPLPPARKQPPPTPVKPDDSGGGPLPNSETGPMDGEGRKPETQNEVVETPDPTPRPAPKHQPRVPLHKRRRIIRSNYLGA